VLYIGRRLIHYARRPLVSVYSVEQGERPDYKPEGLWVSAEGERDWTEYCVSNYPRHLVKIAATEVMLHSDAKVLHISDADMFDEFEKRYYQHANYDNPWTPFTGIDWGRVAKKYQGIIISPYRGDRRFERGGVMWYYPWDCASGCIWDRSAVKELRELVQTQGAGNVGARDVGTGVESD
jgi:hypothetical protein